MASATLDDETATSEKKSKRNTGDWSGFPNFCGVLSILCIPLAILGGGVTGAHDDLLGWTSFFGILMFGVALYGSAALIAAVRGNLSK